jgi:two-component system, sensor histidine kinase LadS
MRCIRWFFGFLLCMLWQFSATAQTPALADIAASPAVTLTVSVCRSSTPMAGLTVAQVAASPQTDFSAFDSAKTHATEPGKPVWLRLRVDTVNNQPANLWTLDFDKPFIDKVVLYTAQSDGTWKQQSAGDSLAHSAWPRQSLNPQFNLPELATGQHDFYVALYNSVPLHVAVTLLTAEEAGVHTQNTILIVGIITGLLAFMCIASGMLGINYRDSACLWYASYAGAVLMLNLSYFGVANYALWTHSIWLRSSCDLIFILAAMALQLQFCRAMFLASSSPAWARYAVHAMALFCVLSIVPVVVHFNLITQTVFFTAPVLMSIVTMVSIVWSNVRRHRVTAWLWVVACTPLLLLIAMAITENMGYSSMPGLPFNAPLYALLFEMPVLLIALNVHIKTQHAKVVRTKTLARTDPRTGFVAAHDFAISLDQLWDTAKVSGQDLAVAYVHITHQLRHVAQQDTADAERSLARAVRLLRSVVREQDVVAHVNTDLFAMLMPDMPLNDKLSARLTRLVALGNMTDKDAAQDAPIRFRIVATTQRSFAGSVQELDNALQHKLSEADGWGRKTIRYVRKRPSHSAGSMVEGESFSQFWERAAQTALESNPGTRLSSTDPV